MGKRIAVIGAGGMGVAASILLFKNGHRVRVWSPFEDEVEMLKSGREHVNKLPGVAIPEEIFFTSDLEEALAGSEVVVLAVPAQTARESARKLKKYIAEGQVIVCCSKGIEENTCMLLSEVVGEEIPGCRFAALSGPSHAEEIARDIPTVVVAACEDRATAEYVQDIFMSTSFRVYTNRDLKGVELGGALKNIIALCAGISDGLGFGDNTKAALMTRGIVEIARLGVALGAHRQTFAGLTGIGDLIVTCTSMYSRNRRAGILIGKGKSVKEALEEVKMVVEGVVTTKPAYELGRRCGVSMPIITEAYRVLYEGKNPRQAVIDLMARDRTHEMEEGFGEIQW